MRLLLSWFAAGRSPAPRPSPLGFERLEARDVPSATPFSGPGPVVTDLPPAQVRLDSSGALIISGNVGNDLATVKYSANMREVIVTLVDDLSTNETRRFPVARVNLVLFSGVDGDDKFTNNTAIRSIAYGGAGNDTLIGGSAQDVFYGGAGNDVLIGKAGDDRLYGEAGDDTISGGAGDEFIYGGTGTNTINAGTGNNTIITQVAPAFGPDNTGFGIDIIAPAPEGSRNLNIRQFGDSLFNLPPDVFLFT